MVRPLRANSLPQATYLDAIKQFEGYAAEARWHYAQNTNGYGTGARFAGEVIDTMLRPTNGLLTRSRRRPILLRSSPPVSTRVTRHVVDV
jgi:hypothetical protein